MKLLLSLLFLSFLGLPAEAQNKRTYRYSKTPKTKKKQIRKRSNRSRSNFQIKRQPKPNKTFRKTLKPKKPKPKPKVTKRFPKPPPKMIYHNLRYLWLNEVLGNTNRRTIRKRLNLKKKSQRRTKR